MAQFLAPLINDQQEDSNGNPLSGGTISVYLAGTSTPANTTSDKAGAIPNSWPIVLNTLGLNTQGAVWLTGGAAYKFVIKDSSNVTLRTIDNVSGINDTTVTTDQWVVFQGTPTFVSATSFTVPGDQTQTFAPYTRIKTSNTGGTVFGTVVRSVFSSVTTVTVIPDSGSLDSGLSVVSTGLIAPANPSIPGSLTTPPFRNRIINGALRIDQRNSSAGITLTAGAAIAYTADRFYASCTGANVSIQSGNGTGYKRAITITGAASNTGTLFGHRVESNNCFDWASRQINVQVPISAVGIASVTWNAYSADVSDVFSAKTLMATGTLALSSTVETKYFSFAASAGALRGVAIEFVTGALLGGQSITYQGAIQAEAGQVSPFEVVEYGEDIRRCQRYLYNPTGVLSGRCTTTAARFIVAFPQLMRATPTTTISGTTIAWEEMQVAARGYTSCTLSAANLTNGGGYFEITGTNANGVPTAGSIAQLNSPASFFFSAEL